MQKGATFHTFFFLFFMDINPCGFFNIYACGFCKYIFFIIINLHFEDANFFLMDINPCDFNKYIFLLRL